MLIFIDSDFWHGWRFKQWKSRLPQKYWVEKIETNIKRDNKKFRKLRSQGYQVFRIWEHQFKQKEKMVLKIKMLLNTKKKIIAINT